MSSFGDPTYSETQLAEAANQPTGEPEIDINDPRLVSENIEIDPKGDAFAQKPVLPDGKWRAKLKSREVGKPPLNKKFAAKKDEKTGALYLYTALDAEIIDHAGDQKFDGDLLSDYFVSTQVRRDKSSVVSTLLDRLGKTATGSTTHGALMNDLLMVLASEPELIIETEWEANCQKCEESAKARHEKKPRSTRGMRNFPMERNSKGQMEHVPRVKCTAVDPINGRPLNHGEMYARPRIISYNALVAPK